MYVIWNLYRQEEQEGEGEGAGTGEDLRHLNAYNRRLRATQSPNNFPFSMRSLDDVLDDVGDLLST